MGKTSTTTPIPADEMTTQDYVALHIYRGLVSHSTPVENYPDLAERAYQAADALCTVREKRMG